jgi:hypothetical protein
MGHTMYIVARDHPELFAYLRDRFSGDGTVEVILDRRFAQRRQGGAHRTPERRRADRRLRPEVDQELKIRAHAIITVSDSNGP